MKPTALLLNLVVAAVAFVSFARSGHFKWKLFYPFAIASIPAAFLGGLINPDPMWYKKILGVLLVFAVLRMFGFFSKTVKEIKELKLHEGLLSGGIIGFFAGLIGIGGGIIFVPLMVVGMGMAMKKAAPTSQMILLFASLSGVIVHSLLGHPDFLQAGLLAIGSFIGGLVGARLSIDIKERYLQILVSAVIIIAAAKLFFDSIYGNILGF